MWLLLTWSLFLKLLNLKHVKQNFEYFVEKQNKKLFRVATNDTIIAPSQPMVNVMINV